MQKILKKEDFNQFISSLIKRYDFIAPTKEEDITKFSVISNPKEICLKELPVYSAKRFFLPEKDILFSFKNKNINSIKPQKKQRILFGIRLCDLNSILRLDHLFMVEKAYKQKRDKTILIGFYCNQPYDKYCFCSSMGLQAYFDLFFIEKGNSYIILVGSEKGNFLVKNLKNINYKQHNLLPKCQKNLNKKELSNSYYSKEWEKLSEKCLSCSTCTALCPTCPCFDINDEIDLNLKEGYRYRKWASCQLPSFTKVAGGKIFRDSRSDRLKHFVYHKVKYFKDSFNDYMCVGCGRCIRNCPTRIDWVKQLNELPT